MLLICDRDVNKQSCFAVVRVLCLLSEVDEWEEETRETVCKVTRGSQVTLVFRRRKLNFCKHPVNACSPSVVNGARAIPPSNSAANSGTEAMNWSHVQEF